MAVRAGVVNLLLLSPFVPDPTAPGGAPRAIFDRVDLLSDRHEITVVAMREPEERTAIPLLDPRVVTLVTVRRRSSSVPLSGRVKWRKRARLAFGLATDARPLLVQEFGNAEMCAAIESVRSSRRFDLVLVEHILMAQYIPCLRTDRQEKVALSDHDVAASQGAVRSIGAGWRLSGWIQRLERAKWHRYVTRAYRSADTILVPTDEDAQLVTGEVQAARVRVVPFGIASTDAGRPAGQRAPSTLVFIGNFDHAPNRDAALWLATEIMPRVWRRKEEAILWLVGHRPTPAIRALDGGRISVLGDVDSVVQYLHRATLYVAPIREGAGMRMKLLEAMDSEIAVITTSLGAHGLGATQGEDIVIAETADGFADAIVDLLEAPVERERIGAAGRRLVASMARRAARAALLERSLA
jgi:glycosyltransferase involved in cell wall biosynthesis